MQEFCFMFGLPNNYHTVAAAVIRGIDLNDVRTRIRIRLTLYVKKNKLIGSEKGIRWKQDTNIPDSVL